MMHDIEALVLRLLPRYLRALTRQEGHCLEGKADEIRAQTTSPAFPSLPRRPDETDPKRLQPRPRILVNPFPFLLRFLLRLEPPGDMNVFHAALLVNDPVSACFGR
jgi:hypothetical protein